MVYDSARAVTVMFGGHKAPNRLGDTWEWNGTDWTLKATTGPDEREYAAMTYDTFCGRVVLFGGQDATPHFHDTWAWDGTSWAQLFPTMSPSARYGSSMIYDPAWLRFVMFGGNTGGGETWAFGWDCTSGTWFPLQTQGSPPDRIHAGMAYVDDCSKAVLFGGLGSSRFADTWLYPSTECVPTVSGVALIGMGGLLLGGGIVVLKRRRSGTA